MLNLNSERDGSTKLWRAMRALCLAVSLSAPTLRAKYPDNDALQAALDACLVVCNYVPTVAEILPTGGDNVAVLDDPENIGGYGADAGSLAPELPE